MAGDASPRLTVGLVGQESAEQRLVSALQSGRMPHAWLLTGRQGIGKATLAYRLARFLLARPDGRTGLMGDLSLDPDDQIFRQVAAGAHPDLFVLERGINDKTGKLRGEIVVEDVRRVGEGLRRTASGGGWRLLVVDAAEDMNRSAANALLKLLEEPPPRALLLLISHAPGRLLPTIRSRCCSLALQPLAPEVLEALLAEQLPELSSEERSLLAALADGSIGQALELEAAGGLALYRRLLAVLNRAGQGAGQGAGSGMDVEEAHAFADAVARSASGESFRIASGLLTWWLARMIRAGAEHKVPPALVAEEEGLAQRLFARRALADWVSLWEKLSALALSCERQNLDRKQAFLSALIALDEVG